MAGTGREALTEGREANPEVREWLEGHHGGPLVVRRLSRMARSGWKALTEGREDFRMAGSGGEALQDGQEWLEGPH